MKLKQRFSAKISLGLAMGLLAMVVWALLCSSPALAGTSKYAVRQSIEQRYKLVSEGFQAMEQKDYDRASQLFDDSLQVYLPPEQEENVSPSRLELQKYHYYSLKSGGHEELSYRKLRMLEDVFPQDEDIHRELGYYYLSKYELRYARDEFVILCERNPENLDYCLQKAYLYLQLGDSPAAIVAFSDILHHHPEHSVSRSEYAYLMFEAEDYEEAATQYELLRMEDPENPKTLLMLYYCFRRLDRPEDAKEYLLHLLEIQPYRCDLWMELGYLYFSQKEYDQAEEVFKKVEKDCEDEEVRESAKAAAENVGISRPKWWFADVYAHSFFTARFPNLINTGRARIGLVPPLVPLKFYLGLRLTRDIRSKGVATDKIYEDNVGIPHVGMDFTPGADLFPYLTLFFEIGPAIYLYDRDPQDQVVLDMRAGAAFGIDWQQNGPVPNAEKNWLVPLQQDDLSKAFFGELYTDLIWFYRFNNNWIGTFQIKEGINLFQYGMLLDQLYLRFNLGYDVDGVFYNNYAELGAGMRVMPWDWLGFQFYAEYILGFYIPRTNSGNPYSTVYNDGRIGVLFSHYW